MIIKRTLIPFLIVIILCSIFYSVLLADEVYKKYTTTLEWDNSSLQQKIHMVPPGLAKNYVSGEEQFLIGLVADVNAALEEIKKNNGISEKKYEEYLVLQSFVNEKIGGNEENEKFLDENGMNELNFYMEAHSIIDNSYETLNIDELERIESIFATRITDKEQEVDKTYLEEIQKISEDFKKLESFSKNALKKLGSVENGILKVDSKVNREITEDLLKEIEEKKLRKFTHIYKLYGMLTSEPWSNILAHNEDSKKYFAWQESKEILENLSKSNYVPVSYFLTVDDVLAKNPNAKLEQKANHTINGASPVKGVYHSGKLLSEDLYVKKGTELDFSIEYEYIENPKSTVTVEYSDSLGELFGTQTFEDYVGNPISINTGLEGYVLVDSVNFVESFGEENVTVKLIYEEYVPPVIEETPEEGVPDDTNLNEEEREPEDDSNLEIEEDSEEVE